MMLKAVILIGGPQKGTRFRPLSLDVPKPLFPVAGLPMVQHHIEACAAVPDIREVLLLGYFPAQQLQQFVADMIAQYKIRIRYLQEYHALGTAGGIYHFRDQIKSGNPDAFFVLNGDVCGDFPLQEMLDFHTGLAMPSLITIMGTEATRQQSTMYGCIVEDKETHQILHYVEKPSTFVSPLINCGVYICSPDIFKRVGEIFNSRQDFYSSFDEGEATESIQLEQDILMPIAGTGQAYVYTTDRWWSQIKTAGSAIYANRHYLQLYHRTHPSRLTDNGPSKPKIVGDVYIHPSATVDPSAVLGPNVSVGKNAVIGAGVRIRESIVLGNSTIQEHSCVLYTVVGWNSTVGAWTRLEGTPCDPNPNKPFAKMDNVPLFNTEGKLNPSITILGCNVTVPSEVIVLNSIVLPYKDLPHSYKNEIIL
ncbi:mannose-1-phosphate guanyltransferase alpha-A-like isoform X1 [Portunus trituberculatus]|uniref:mannose-1-phosphate guanyltransferase alpha-A-like isoform X1 n=1 Tax=Portunus trituberculatus TaxID=210409 RepID=UPI001E1D1AFA|nr:mannose-1-phosphate guanyltransferase alpha-A-like isoform X1 [Portunus trituberculatus]